MEVTPVGVEEEVIMAVVVVAMEEDPVEVEEVLVMQQLPQSPRK